MEYRLAISRFVKPDTIDSTTSIQKQHVRMQRIDQFERLHAICSLTDDDEFGFISKNRYQALSKNGMIVGDQNSCSVHTGSDRFSPNNV